MRIRIFACGRKTIPRISKRWQWIILRQWRNALIYLPNGFSIAWKKNRLRTILSGATVASGLVLFTLSLFLDGTPRWSCAYAAGCCVAINSFILFRLEHTLFYSLLTSWWLVISVISILINTDIAIAKGNFWYLLFLPGIIIAGLFNSFISSNTFADSLATDRYSHYINTKYGSPKHNELWKKFEEEMMAKYQAQIQRSKTA